MFATVINYNGHIKRVRMYQSEWGLRRDECDQAARNFCVSITHFLRARAHTRLKVEKKRMLGSAMLVPIDTRCCSSYALLTAPALLTVRKEDGIVE
jgi:hypothetical protein